MKKIALTLILLSLILLCGCSGSREIDRGYIVTAIGFEQNNDNIIILAEALSSQASSESPTQLVTLSAKGKSIAEAYNALKTQLTKPLYFEHLGALIINESLSAQNTLNSLKFCSELQSASLGLYVVKTPDIQLLFEYESPSGVLGYDIIGLIKNYTKTTGVTANNQLYMLQRRQTNTKLLLPTVSVTQDKLSLNISEGEK